MTTTRCIEVNKRSLVLAIALLCFGGMSVYAQETKAPFSIGDKWYYSTERIGWDGLGEGSYYQTGEHDEIALGVVIYEVVEATETKQNVWHYTVSRTIRDCYARDSIALPIYMDIAPDGKVWMQEGDYPRNLVHDPSLQVSESFQVTVRATENPVNPWLPNELGEVQQVGQQVVLSRIDLNERMLHNPRVYRYEANPLSGEYWSFYNNSGYIEGVGFNAPSFYPYRGVFGNPGVVCMTFNNSSPMESLRGFVSVDGDTIISDSWRRFGNEAPLDTVCVIPSTVAIEEIVASEEFTYDPVQQTIQPLEGSILALYSSSGELVAISQGENLSLSHYPDGIYIVYVRKEERVPYHCCILK